MKFLNWLFANTPKETDAPPEVFVPFNLDGLTTHKVFRPNVALLTQSDARETVAFTESRPHLTDEALGLASDLGDAFCVLRYTDAGGDFSERRISMKSLKKSADHIYLNAFCFERQAARQFRLDRIIELIDEDGQVHDTFSYFTIVLGIPLRGQNAAESEVSLAAANLLKIIRPGLAILTAVARADKSIHLSEIDAIEIYAEREVAALFREGVIDFGFNMDAVSAMGRTIALMRPLLPTLRYNVTATCAWPEARFRRLSRAVEAVIYADGKLHDREVDIVGDMDDFARQSAADRIGAVRDWEARFDAGLV